MTLPRWQQNWRKSSLHAGPSSRMSLGGFRRSPRAMVITLAVIAFANSAYYLILAYLPSYLQTELKMSSDSALLLSVLVMGSMMIAVPFFGRLGDRYGRRPLLAASAALYLLLAVQVVSLLNSGNETTVYLTAILAGLALAPYAASSCAALTILFPRSSRFTAFTLAYNVSTALFGGSIAFNV
ncbi:MFS transporter [Pseudomonas sp. BJa3]|uniref:MFS transporter n=1 Tax=Pseudomonas sp. BJa3 TaxID=2986525 RepID=UPI002265E6A5|nr:MFS transporter [Pseudomonas sp. BJa3]MCX5510454.1 MFS transporter [Pseudomonas sp. BJa3]